MSEIHDVVIVGSGPAGYTAADKGGVAGAEGVAVADGGVAAGLPAIAEGGHKRWSARR